jgi:ABC-2 type transport system ATP-binding protein
MPTEPELAPATDACVNNEQEPFLPGVLAVAGLRKSYGSVQAVRDVSFTVRAGEIVALLGPNGAGKTTTLEILEGFRARDGGTAEVLGIDPGDRSRGRELRERTGLVLQDIAVEPYLTVRETVSREAGYYPAPAACRRSSGSSASPGWSGARSARYPAGRSAAWTWPWA